MFEIQPSKIASAKNDILSGLTVALALVPEAVAFAFVAGVQPLVGLYAAFMVGLITACLGGRPGMISGATGALAVVMVALEGSQLHVLLGLVVLTMAIIHFLPRYTRALPSSLVAILVVSGLVFGLDLETRVVGDVASIKGGLPSFHIPSVPFSFDTLIIIFPYAVILASIGLIESLLTLRLVDEITETRGRGNKECVAQGIANTATGLFGGMGGCAMIGQSMINVNSGGRGRLSGITAALCLLLFILVGSSLIEKIPLAALIGVMFIVVIGTFEWSSFRVIRKVPRSDALVLLLVSAVTVATDLAIAVVVGVIVSALVFAWEHAKHILVEAREDHKGSTVYAITGPLFFGSVTSFLERFDPSKDNDDVVIDFARSRVADHSGLEAIDTLAERYLSVGKTLHLVHLSEECRKLLRKAGSLVEVNVIEDPKYFVADDILG